MSALKGLTFAAYTRPDSMSPEQKRRQKLVLHMREQLELAKAQAEGRNYAPTKRKWVQDSEGAKTQLEVPKRLKPWWQAQANGGLLLTLRYGARPIEFEKGKAAIQVKSRDELLVLLPKLMTAVEAGELDGLITATTKQRSAPRRNAA